MHQKSRSSFNWVFWLELTRGVAVNLWPSVLDWVWRISFQDSSFTWLLAWGLSSLPRGPPVGLLEYLHDMEADFSQSETERGKA